MMKFKFVGLGACGNKACMTLLNQGVCSTDDVIMINSTSRDIPNEFTGKTLILSPDDRGCGKERPVAKEYALSMIKCGMLDEAIEDAQHVVLVTSTEGGTGSGATPIIGRYISTVLEKEVHIFAFTGFLMDIRGIENTINFFKDLDFPVDIQVQDNRAYTPDRSLYSAERVANLDFAEKMSVLCGKDLIASSQNLDETDIFKVISTSGYKIIEKKDITGFTGSIDTSLRFMIKDSKSLPSEYGQIRLGVILNIDRDMEDNVDPEFKALTDTYGQPFEIFIHKQWDGKAQYVAYIASGMKLPYDYIKEIYDKKVKVQAKMNTSDDFFSKIGSLDSGASMSFDMVKKNGVATTKESFYKQFDVKATPRKGD